MIHRLAALALVLLLTSAAIATGTNFHRGVAHHGSGGGGGGGLLSTTITLQNDSGSAQAAGAPTEFTGWLFKDGDICGSAPIFVDAANDTTVQPYSAGMQTYFPSGCLMKATFVWMPTFSIAGNGSHGHEKHGDRQRQDHRRGEDD